MPRHNGLDLKVRRIRARLTQEALAESMGISRVRVGQIEGMADISKLVKERYLTGLTRAQLAKREGKESK